MKYSSKVVSYSLGALLLVALLGFLADNPSDHYAGMTFGLFTAAFTVIEMVVLLIIGLYFLISKPRNNMVQDDQLLDPDQLAYQEQKRAHRAKAAPYFLSAVLVLVVGTSVCFSGAALINAI